MASINESRFDETPGVDNIDITKSYQAEDADLTIISADGMHFKVHRLVLTLASTVFKDMLALPSNEDTASTLSLCDSAIASGQSVKGFLDMIYGQPVPQLTKESIAPLRMIQKYDCASARRLALYAYESMLIHTDIMPIDVFRAAAILDSVHTCALAIRTNRPLTWTLTSPHKLNQSIFDLRAMRREEMITIPIEFSWALLQAHLIVDMSSQIKLTN